MSKSMIDIDDQMLARAQQSLGTTTKRDTVNEALAQVVAFDARRRNIARLHEDRLPDLRDHEVMRAASER